MFFSLQYLSGLYFVGPSQAHNYNPERESCVDLIESFNHTKNHVDQILSDTPKISTSLLSKSFSEILTNILCSHCYGWLADEENERFQSNRPTQNEPYNRRTAHVLCTGSQLHIINHWFTSSTLPRPRPCIGNHR